MSQALIAQLERIRRELSKQPTPENSRRLMRDFQRAVETWRDAGNPKTEEILRTLREITSALEMLYVADRTVDVGEFTKDLFNVSGQLVEGVANIVRAGMTASGSQTTAQIAKQLEQKFKNLHLPRIRQWAYTWARTARGAEAQTRAMGVRADVAPEQQFFRYDGPVTNMRPFCRGIIGQVFSLKEIRAMKSPNGLPVDQYCGGYNCRHRWVRVAGVPAGRVINRVLAPPDYEQSFVNMSKNARKVAEQELGVAKKLASIGEDVEIDPVRAKQEKGDTDLYFRGKPANIKVPESFTDRTLIRQLKSYQADIIMIDLNQPLPSFENALVKVRAWLERNPTKSVFIIHSYKTPITLEQIR